jgi:hypothetical protein
VALRADPLLSADPTTLGRAALPPPRTPEAASAGEAGRRLGLRPPAGHLSTVKPVHCWDERQLVTMLHPPCCARRRQAARAGRVPEQQDHAAAGGARRRRASSGGPERRRAGPQPASQGQRRAILPAAQPVRHSRPPGGGPEVRRRRRPGQVPGAACRPADPQPRQHAVRRRGPAGRIRSGLRGACQPKVACL